MHEPQLITLFRPFEGWKKNASLSVKVKNYLMRFIFLLDWEASCPWEWHSPWTVSCQLHWDSPWWLCNCWLGIWGSWRDLARPWPRPFHVQSWSSSALARQFCCTRVERTLAARDISREKKKTKWLMWQMGLCHWARLSKFA